MLPHKTRLILGLLGTDFFSGQESGLFKPLYDELTRRDEYFLMADFDPYFNVAGLGP